jgi:Flp pilus assembly protein TadD
MLVGRLGGRAFGALAEVVSVTHTFRRTILALVGGVLLTGCNTMRPPRDSGSADPESEVAAVRTAWMTQPCSGVSGGQDASFPALRSRAESVAFYNPRHASSRYLAALMAYQDNDRTVAVHHLDDLLQLDPAHAEAATMRARIALEDGNTPYAVRMLEERIGLRPDNPGLRETLASAYYLDGQLDQALDTLVEAERLGAPKDRVLYNRGLIEEGRGKNEIAAENYRGALAVQPYWALPRERLKGLGLPTTVAVAAPPALPAPAPATEPKAKVVVAPPKAPAPAATPAAAPAPKVVAPKAPPAAPPSGIPVAPTAPKSK